MNPLLISFINTIHRLRKNFGLYENEAIKIHISSSSSEFINVVKSNYDHICLEATCIGIYISDNIETNISVQLDKNVPVKLKFEMFLKS